MEADLQSLFGLHVTFSSQLYSLAETPQAPHPPSPALGLVYEGAIGQQRWTLSLCNPLQRIHNTTCILPDGLLCVQREAVRAPV
jgi:hypothetical protein